jgi:hypothetical protein
MAVKWQTLLLVVSSIPVIMMSLSLQVIVVLKDPVIDESVLPSVDEC